MGLMDSITGNTQDSDNKTCLESPVAPFTNMV